MTDKIRQLKAQNAKVRIKKTYEYLNIQQIFSQEDEKGELLSKKFIQTGIWKYENRPIASFEFHSNGIINPNLVKTQLNEARNIFKKELFQLNTEKIYISLKENDIFCWIEIDFKALCQHLNLLWEQYGDFPIFLEDVFALAIHRGEYEWEVLRWKKE